MLKKLYLNRIFLTILVLAASAVLRANEPARVDAALPERSFQIGEPVPLKLQLPLDIPPASVSASPSREQTHSIFVGDPELRADGWIVPLRFLTDELEQLQPVTVTVSGGENETDRVFTTAALDVSISPPQVDAGEAQDFTPYMEPPVNWARITAFSAGGLAALALALLPLIIWMARRKTAAAQPVVRPPMPPVDELDARLSALETLDLWRSRGTEAHYTELSAALRRYLERAHRFPAMEMTDDEVMRAVRHSLTNHAADVHLRPVFQRASFAKYARVDLPENDVREDLEACRAFVHSLRPRPAEPEER